MNKAMLAEFQKKVWLVEPRTLNALAVQLTEAASISLSLADTERKEPAAELQVIAGVAVIPIKGVLMNQVPWFFGIFGIDATAYSQISDMIKEALGDKSVESILLDVDSPGGEVGSVLETAEAIKNAAAQKPVRAQVGDLGASGAYWLMSQAREITASPNSGVGSIGVYTVYVDWSKAAEKDGARVHVIKSGDLKGMGVMGAEISDEQINAMQRYIDGIADNFIKSVANGRGKPVEEIKKLATGQLWIAKDGKKLGLVDSVNRASPLSNNVNNKNLGARIMSEEKKDEQAVETRETKAEAAVPAQPTAMEERERFTALKAAFPDDLAFAAEQYEAGSSVQDAKAKYAEILQKRLAEKEAENAQLKANAEKAAAEKAPAKSAGGASPLKHVDGEAGGDEADLMVLAKERAGKKGISVGAAIEEIYKEDPDFCEAYRDKITATN